LIKLHRMTLSGQWHRVELFLSLLGLAYELVDVDLAKGEHKTPAFLALNPFGPVPVLQDGDVTLADSNAILVSDPSVRAWLARIEQLPRFVPMAKSPVGLAA
jgi:glutathione S-transferase